MRKEAARHLSHLLIFDVFRRNRTAIALCLLFLACILFSTTNIAISPHITEGRFVRWTMQQSIDGQGTPYAFIDLPDGRTVGAAISLNRPLPEPGSMVKVEETAISWGGKSYRVVP